MSFSFITDFFTGLVKQHTNDNGIFNQGKLFLKYNGIFVDSGRVHMIPLQITSSKKLGSITEAMNGDDSIMAFNNKTKMHISENEEEFNKTLVEYSNLFNTYSDDLIHNNTKRRDNRDTDNVTQQLKTLNKKLISLADKINTEIGLMDIKDNILKQDMNKQQDTLSSYIEQLKGQSESIRGFNPMYVNAKEENFETMSNSYMLSRVNNNIIFILIFMIICIFLYCNKNNYNGMDKCIIVIISLLLLFIVYRR